MEVSQRDTPRSREVVEEGQRGPAEMQLDRESGPWAQLDQIAYAQVQAHHLLLKDDGTMDTNMGSGAKLPGSKSAGFSSCATFKLSYYVSVSSSRKRV